MRILNEDNNEVVYNVTLLLTIEEIMELKGDLESILSKKSLITHYHTDDKENKHEITVALYIPDGSLETFSPRVRKLILEDK